MAGVQPLANPNTTKFFHGHAPKFRYVYYLNAMTKGEIAQWTDTAANLGWGVEDAVVYTTRPAGVVPVTITAAGWGWIQYAGFCDYITTDGDVDVPHADTLQSGDLYLVADANSLATGMTLAQFNDGTADANDTFGQTSLVALNLATDTDTVGICQLICP